MEDKWSRITVVFVPRPPCAGDAADARPRHLAGGQRLQQPGQFAFGERDIEPAPDEPRAALLPDPDDPDAEEYGAPGGAAEAKVGLGADCERPRDRKADAA